MIMLIIAVVAVVVCILRGFKKPVDIICPVIFFLAIIWVFISLFVSPTLPRQLVKQDTIKLVSLRDGSNVHGSFFLGTGNIGTDEYYFFYKEVEAGVYQPSKVRVNDNVTIRETEREDGQLIVYTARLTNPRLSLWLLVSLEEIDCKYEFVIPKGSIQRKFALQ